MGTNDSRGASDAVPVWQVVPAFSTTYNHGMPAQVSVRSFGPIDEATVDPRRLTIFTGPNNSGKSYLAAVLYAAYSANPLRRQPWTHRLRIRNSQGSWPESLLAQAQELILEGRDRRRVYEADMPDPMREYFKTRCVELLRDYGQTVAASIESAFGASLAELVRIPSRPNHPFRLRLTAPEDAWRVQVSLRQGDPVISVRPQPDIDRILRGVVRAAFRSDRNAVTSYRAAELLEEIEYRLLTHLFHGWPLGVYYLPAARSGILQSQRLLLSSWMQQAARVGREAIALAPLSGIVVDFIDALLTIEPRRLGELSHAADSLQQSVIDGAVTIDGEPLGTRGISYHHEGVDLPVQRASSMVSELAPIVLFLRHLVRPGDLLVIEEPEAHLHPAMQARLALALQVLVGDGPYVLLTTHSEFFLSQLSNVMLEETLRARTTPRLPEPDRIPLDVTNIAPYRFVKDGWRGGSTVVPMEATNEGGITQDEFSDVAERIYSQSVELDRKLAGSG